MNGEILTWEKLQMEFRISWSTTACLICAYISIWKESAQWGAIFISVGADNNFAFSLRHIQF